MIRRSARGGPGDSTGTMDHRYDEPHMLTETILCDKVVGGVIKTNLYHEALAN